MHSHRENFLMCCVNGGNSSRLFLKLTASSSVWQGSAEPSVQTQRGRCGWTCWNVDTGLVVWQWQQAIWSLLAACGDYTIHGHTSSDAFMYTLFRLVKTYEQKYQLECHHILIKSHGSRRRNVTSHTGIRVKFHLIHSLTWSCEPLRLHIMYKAVCGGSWY